MIKYLNPISKFAIDDNTTSQIIIQAYDYYKDKSVNKQIGQSKEYSQVFSCFVRFFNSINSTKPIDDEHFQNTLKNEILKGKNESIKILNEKIKDILQIQSKRVLFSESEPINSLKNVPLKENNKGSNISKIVNFDFKIDVPISSHYSNRLLTPEIYFIFTLDDGTILKTKVDIRMFNEFRKDLTLNIKKILTNEGVNLLK